MKDHFSTESDKYAQYRPTYPKALFEFLKTLVSNPQQAWDCGTGNGQVAIVLSQFFNKVFATDISASQIQHATPAKNIFYSVQQAENTNFQDDSFDLITVAQAIHWFDFERFYNEVKRTSKANALLAIIGYGRIRIEDKIDAIIDELYVNIIGKYWDKERRYIDEEYATIPFPFQEIKAPEFNNEFSWTLQELVGYLNTWSAVKHYIQAKGNNPIDLIYSTLNENWGIKETKTVKFPLLLRIGKIHDLP